MSAENFNDFLDGQFAAQDAAAGGAPEAPAAPAAPAVESTPPPAQEEAPLDLDGDLGDQDKFDRAYVERLRKEAAASRTKAKELESAFEGYDADQRQGLFELARMLREDPKAAAAEMKAAYDTIMEQYAEPETPVEDPADLDRLMTVREYQEFQERQAVASEQRAIEAEARELGYTARADNLEYRQLLLVAQHQTKTGSISEAHKIISDAKAAAEQAAVDRYIAAKAAEAQSSYTAPADNAGQIPSGAEPIKDFKQARMALENYIAQQKR